MDNNQFRLESGTNEDYEYDSCFMDKFEIEHALNEIIGECDFFSYENPITYLLFLDRYRHRLTPIQIYNTEQIIENLKSKNNAYTNMNLKKFEDPICSLPIHERGTPIQKSMGF